MSKDIQVFHNGKIDLPVKEVDGQVYFKAEASAIGLGISQIKNGKVYVRWENVSKYLSQHVGKGDWITEPQFYKLAFKAAMMLPRNSKTGWQQMFSQASENTVLI